MRHPARRSRRYEIHIGQTSGEARARPFAHVAGEAEGAVSANGRVMGSYLHGMFSGDDFRRAFLRQLGATPSTTSYAAGVEETLDRLAAHLEAHLDVDGPLGDRALERGQTQNRENNPMQRRIVPKKWFPDTTLLNARPTQ